MKLIEHKFAGQIEEWTVVSDLGSTIGIIKQINNKFQARSACAERLIYMSSYRDSLQPIFREPSFFDTFDQAIDHVHEQNVERL